MFNDILKSLLHIHHACFVYIKAKRTRYNYYSFIVLLSFHYCLRNKIYYTKALPEGGGGEVSHVACPNFKTSHVACPNFKTSRVGVYKCFTPLSEIERKFFIFVGIVEKGKSDAL